MHVEPSAISLEVISAEDIPEYTQGSWWSTWTEEDGDIEYYHYEPDTMAYMMTYRLIKDGVTYEGNRNEISEQTGYWIYAQTNQSRAWDKGMHGVLVYTEDSENGGAFATTNVEIVENPKLITEIAVEEPATIIENTCGETRWDQIYDENGAYIGEEEYYYYNPGYTNIKYTITYSDGTTAGPWTWNEIGNETGSWIEFTTIQSASTPWTVGNTYPVTGRIGTAVIAFEITVVEAPTVESVTVESVTVKENTNGGYEYGPDGWYYNYNSIFENLQITVEMSDGSEASGDRNTIEQNWEGQYPFEIDLNQAEKPLLEGENTVPFTFMGYEGTFTVVVEPSTISLEVITGIIQVPEYTHGSWSFRETEEGEIVPCFYYDIGKIVDQVQYQLTVGETIYEGNRSEIHNEAGLWITVAGNLSEVWEQGSAHEIMTYIDDLENGGAYVTVNVEIVENPKLITEVEVVEPATIIENTCGYISDGPVFDEDGVYIGDKEFYFYRLDYSNIKYMVTYSDGTTAGPRTLAEIEKETESKITFKTAQRASTPWVVGGTYPVTGGRVGLANIEFEVTIVEAPTVESVTVEPVTVKEYTTGGYEYGPNGWYYYYGLIENPQISVMLSDGSLVSGDRYTIEQNWEGQYLFEINLNQAETPLIQGENIVSFAFMGVEGTFTVTVEPSATTIEVLSGVQIPEYTQGSWREYISEDGESSEYFRYDIERIIRSLNSMEYRLIKDGVIYTGNRNDIGNQTGCWITAKSNQNEPWEKGAHEILVYVYDINESCGAYTTTNVNIVENPKQITSISVEDQPVPVIVNTHGHYIWDSFYNENGEYIEEREYYYYHPEDINAKYTVAYSDGTTAESVTRNVIETEIGVGIEFTTNQSLNTPWLLGGTYPVTVKLGTVTDTFNVRIIENPVASISGMTIIDADDYYEEYNTEEGIYHIYDLYSISEDPNTVITVTYNDGSETLTGTRSEIYEQTIEWVAINDPQNAVNQWTAGTYEVPITYMGVEGVWTIEIRSTSEHVHEWGETIYNWSEDYSTVTALRTCLTDVIHVEEETVATTYEVITAAGCETTGIGRYTSDAFANDAFAVQTKDVDLKAVGHDYGEPEWTWTEDYSAASATFVCRNDNGHSTVKKAAVSAKEGTGADLGFTVYTAVVILENNEYTDYQKVKRVYEISIDNSNDGTVTADKLTASAGETITLRIVPAIGRELKSLFVTSGTGSQIETKRIKDGTYTFTMPTANVRVTATYILLNPFTDVSENRWFYAPVMWAYSTGVTTGATATTFEPNKTCTRAEFVAFLYKYMGMPWNEAWASECNFSDVKETNWFYRAVIWANHVGVTHGTTSTTFSPNVTLDRAMVISFLYNMEKYQHGTPKVTLTSTRFTDVPKRSYYYDPVLWAEQYQITNGSTPTTFAPADNCTRAEAVAFLYNIDKYWKK